jgi:O-methyltransferase
MPADKIHIYKGWFEETLGKYPGAEIAVLRLDGDWYESTMTCLDQLFPYVSFGGIVLLDDYDAWDGCALATHDFLSKNKSRSRLFRTPLTIIAYIQKIDND